MIFGKGVGLGVGLAAGVAGVADVAGIRGDTSGLCIIGVEVGGGSGITARDTGVPRGNTSNSGILSRDSGISLRFTGNTPPPAGYEFGSGVVRTGTGEICAAAECTAAKNAKPLTHVTHSEGRHHAARCSFVFIMDRFTAPFIPECPDNIGSREKSKWHARNYPSLVPTTRPPRSRRRRMPHPQWEQEPQNAAPWR